jgi:hypothetical protein
MRAVAITIVVNTTPTRDDDRFINSDVTFLFAAIRTSVQARRR